MNIKVLELDEKVRKGGKLTEEEETYYLRWEKDYSDAEYDRIPEDDYEYEEVY